MKVHPREKIVNKADLEFADFYIAWFTKHDLTFGEIVRILSSTLASVGKYLIRSERHPDEPGKAGGIA